ncbi:adenosylcobinamide-phosphate synthase [Psychromonas sp. psych-6C06]|uniref:cobalamin biosynthesis protein n=1 Tax=Psychromonas sp. psych-6C06 TaxID=2058089 RepID=UPI000C3290C2|nr:cobalamin biosynthesis protein [Psychromonas sp. psych-6C06]PKF62184.1 adenosylcobinamide-phosphate synthase [Psychromonas sp. psych-6C06]
MDHLINFIEQYSHYFSIIAVALLSFFISLPKDLNPLAAVELIFRQIAVKVNLEERSDAYKRVASLLSISLIFFPTILIISQLYNIVYRPLTIDILLLFILLSWHDKKVVYLAISDALKRNNLPLAKFKLNSLTERETKPLSLMGVNKATIESMVLQLSASWFAVLFWYMVAGIYGAIFYRTIQICSQQWNAKKAEFTTLTSIPSFIYTLMLFPVHLLISFTFALYDRPLQNLPKKFKQSMHWHHFSSGLMLASFALSMQLELGGVRLYQDQKITYATLGSNAAPAVEKIELSLQRISLSAWFWLCCFTGYTFFPLILEFMRI